MPKPSYSPEDVRRIVSHFPTFAEECLKIQPKQGGKLIPFRLNRMQMDLHSRRTKRDIDLKARQMGITTYKTFNIYHNCTTHTDWHALIVGNEEQLPQVLLAKIKLALKYMPDEFRPRIEYNTRSQLTFPDFRSSITVGTARVQRKQSGAKLGRTYQEVLITEAADPAIEDDTIKMVLQTVPDDGIVSMESTPKGRRGYYYQQWQLAKKGEGGFSPHFYPWWWDAGYVAVVPFDFQMSEEERTLADAYELTPEQICWRRNKVSEIGEETFREQYPENDIDCFLFSGSQFFSRTDLMHFLEMPEYCKDWPAWRGTLQTNPKSGRIDRVALATGPLTIYREPEKGRTYIVGADVAENVEKGDYSCAVVIDWQTCEQVAEWHGRIDPDLYGYSLAALGTYYNNAFMVVEANGPGNTTTLMLDRQLRYQPLFYRERQTGNVNYNKPGWLTTSGNKGPLMHGLAKHIREWSFTPHSEELIGELMTIVCDPLKRGDERYAAESGCYDDRVMALGIALAARESTQCIPRENDHLSSIAMRQREEAERDGEGKTSYESWMMNGS